MKQLSMRDIRTAMSDMLVPTVQNFTEEELFSADFWADLQMDEQKILCLTSNLENTYHIKIPGLVIESIQMKNTVGTFLSAINQHLIDLDEN